MSIYFIEVTKMVKWKKKGKGDKKYAENPCPTFKQPNVCL